MSHVMGMALALAVGWNGTNGFNPNDLLILSEVPNTYKVEASTALLEWFQKDPDNNADLLRYLVRCAIAKEKTITLTLPDGRSWSWPGALGLAEPFDPAVDEKKPFRFMGAKAQRPKDVDKWVSACILAHANASLSHQFISIRGNPTNAKGDQVLPVPPDEERWTMGYPEGVFFGALFDQAATASEDLRSYTVSLNLPEGYHAPFAGWRPPNAVLGRTLDFADETFAAQPDGGSVRVAARLGTYKERVKAFRVAPNQRDADYHIDAICVDGQSAPTPCGTGTPEILRPLFVHLPRLANLEAAEVKVVAGRPFQVLSVGAAIRADQVKPCAAGACVGPHPYLKAGGPVGHASPRAEGGKLVDLAVKQVLEPTLRLISAEEAKGVKVVPGTAFTAIIRYACKEMECKARVRLQTNKRDAFIDVGDSWPSTGSSSRYQWLQVHPVMIPAGAGAEVALRIQIEGAKGPAPELDAVGFLPRPPQCEGRFAPRLVADAPFMGVCHYQ